MYRTLRQELICGLLIVLFVYTAVSKWIDFAHFQRMLSQSPFIGHFALPLSWLIPLSEIVISVCLLVPALRKTGLIASLMLLTIFTLYIVYMLLFVPLLPCSCGGVIQRLSWRQHLLFNLLFIAVSINGIYLMRRARNWSSLVPYPTKEDIL